jgi:hypothetical protein
MTRLWYQRALPRMAAGVLLTSLPLFAQAGAGGAGPTPLRIKYKAGEISKYQTNMAISLAGNGGPKGAQGGNMPLQQLSVVQQFKTSKVLPNGSAEIIVTTTNMQGGAGMGTTPLPKPVTLVMDSRGAVKSAQGNMGGNVPTMFSNMLGSNALGTQQIPLPEKAVKPGDIWANSYAMPGMGAGTVKGQYVRVQTVGKHKTALLHYLINIPVKMMMDSAMQPTQSAAAAQMTMSGTIVMNVDNDVDLLAGRLIRSTGNGNMVMTITSKNQPKPPAPRAGVAPRPVAPGTMKVNTTVTLGTTLIE